MSDVKSGGRELAVAGSGKGGSNVHLDLCLYPTRTVAENRELGVLSETLGFRTVWVPDSPVLWREMWVTMTAIAAATKRVRFGSAVTSGITRHPAVTASSSMSLAEFSGNRLLLGLGNGDSSLVTTGSGRPQTVKEFRETVENFSRLMSGEAASFNEKQIQMPWAGQAKVPIYVAATGPRMLQLAGEIADGVIVMVGVAEKMVKAAIDCIHAGARSAGRDPKSIDIIIWTAFAVSDAKPSDALAAVKANVARASIRKLPAPIAEEHIALVDRIREAYDYAYHSTPGAPHGELVTESLSADFAIAGTSDRCADQLRGLLHLPLNAIALALPDSQQLDRGEMMKSGASVFGKL